MASPFNPTTYDTFIQAVEDGETVKAACQRANVHWRTVSGWMADERNLTADGESAGARYARARSLSALWFEGKAVEAAESASPENVQVKRLQVDTYKWRAAMADPKTYGERRNVEVTGSLVHEHIAALKAINAKHLPSATSRIALPDHAQPVTPHSVSEVSGAGDTGANEADEHEGRS